MRCVRLVRDAQGRLGGMLAALGKHEMTDRLSFPDLLQMSWQSPMDACLPRVSRAHHGRLFVNVFSHANPPERSICATQFSHDMLAQGGKHATQSRMAFVPPRPVVVNRIALLDKPAVAPERLICAPQLGWDMPKAASIDTRASATSPR